MISIFLMGGLGNQLFQIFTTIAYSLRHKKPFKFQYSETLKIGVERPTYWNSFLKRLKPFTTNDIIRLPLYRERGFQYVPIPIIQQNVMLHGYYQSYKYFEDQYENIIRMIQLRKQQNEVREKYKEYFKEDNTISMHFRLGDYKEKQEYHPVMKVEYYRKALRTIIDKTTKQTWNILYFCQEEDNVIVNKSIQILQNEFQYVTFVKVEDTMEDWEQMLAMSCCDHNIIANSSFSWWGAYFNENLNKIICYPSIWFGPAIGHKIMDNLFKDNWVKIT